MNYYVLTFENVSQAIKFEKLCKEKGFEGALIPVPRRISSSCGLAAKFNPSLKREVLEIIAVNTVGAEALYFFKQKGYKTEVERKNFLI